MDLLSHRATYAGCWADPEGFCAGQGCCVGYTIPFCGNPDDYGAASPMGSIECMKAEGPVPMSAEPPTDLEISLAAEAFESEFETHIFMYFCRVSLLPLRCLLTNVPLLILLHYPSPQFASISSTRLKLPASMTALPSWISWRRRRQKVLLRREMPPRLLLHWAPLSLRGSELS
jgi:hypothetical protein